MESRYLTPQIYLHWIVFLLVVLAYGSIEFRVFFEKGVPFRTYLVLSHFSFGFLVWFLMIIRLCLFIKNKNPEIYPAPPRWQMSLAQIVHILLYIFFITLPAMGLIAKYIKGTEWFIIGISMPFSVSPNQELAKQIISWHKTISSFGYWLVGIHASAALMHHYILKDNTLLRMTFLKNHKV